jgi:hypothetical protein
MSKAAFFLAACLAAPVAVPTVVVAQDAPQAASGSDVPSGARSLAGTRWRAAADGALFREVLFLPGMMSITQQDGSNVTFVADLTGTHPACLGYSGCVLTLTADNTVQPFYFGTDDEQNLFHVECVGAPLPDGVGLDEDPRLEVAQGSVIYRNQGAVCWNRNLTPYSQVPPIREEFEEIETP